MRHSYYFSTVGASLTSQFSWKVSRLRRALLQTCFPRGTSYTRKMSRGWVSSGRILLTTLKCGLLLVPACNPFLGTYAQWYLRYDTSHFFFLSFGDVMYLVLSFPMVIQFNESPLRQHPSHPCVELLIVS